MIQKTPTQQAKTTMDNNTMYIAIAVIVAFIAVWFAFIAPAERRHNERKLEIVRKRIEKRNAAAAEQGSVAESGASQPEESSQNK